MADHTRHLDLYDAHDLSVTLIGAGGIGAAAALILAKMGVGALTIYDDDIISEVNIPTQFHRLGDVGQPKVFSLIATLTQFSDDCQITARNERVTYRDSLVDPIIISAVDSIDARQQIWAAVQRGMYSVYIDARMAALEYQQYAVVRGDSAWYEQILLDQDDSTAVQEPCTARATIFTAAMAAGHIGNAVMALANRFPLPRRLIHNISRGVITII